MKNTRPNKDQVKPAVKAVGIKVAAKAGFNEAAARVWPAWNNHP